MVISDFNCPYCYTLNEWIFELGASSRVRWVGIEHRPELPFSGENKISDRQTLTAEVNDVRSRAPEVAVSHPAAWINSHQALLYQNALEDDDPEHAPIIRRKIFQAYWQKGQLISQEHIIQEMFHKHGLSLPEVEPDYLEELSIWWKENLDRIPCMIAPTGVAHLGLQDKRAVQSFLNSALRETPAGPGCL